jgi:hypothetical protein
MGTKIAIQEISLHTGIFFHTAAYSRYVVPPKMFSSLRLLVKIWRNLKDILDRKKHG